MLRAPRAYTDGIPRALQYIGDANYIQELEDFGELVRLHHKFSLSCFSVCGSAADRRWGLGLLAG